MRRITISSALVLLAACGSGPALEQGDLTVAGPPNQSCGGSCGFVSGFALGTSGAFDVFASSNGGNATPSIDRLDFESGTSNAAAWTPSLSFNGNALELAATGNGTLVMAGTFLPAQQTSAASGVYLFATSESKLDGPAAPIAGPLPNLGPNVQNADIDGLVADATDLYVAYGQTTSSGGNPTSSNPDAQFFPASTTPYEARSTGAVVKISHANPATPAATLSGFSFTPGLVLHQLAQNDTDVFWPDEGSATGPTNVLRVLAAAKSDFGASGAREIAELPQGADDVVISGIAANKTTVVWAVASVGNASTGCKLYTSPANGSGNAKVLAENVGGNCAGLAVDDTYAYVALVHTATSQNNGGGNGNNQVLIGSGIARVPLAGGSVELVSLDSKRWYGPRRVLVDGTFVYAIDPTFVIRFPKTAFSPSK